MKIAIDISPLQTGHKVRGVGFYLKNLKKTLLRYDTRNDYIFFAQDEKLDNKADLVHYPYFEPFFITLPFFSKQKRVVTVHDLTPIVFPEHFPAGIKGKFSWQVQKFNLQRSDGIITDSESSKKDIIRYVGAPESKIHVVYLAAGDEFKKLEAGNWRLEILKRYKLPEQFVLYVGDVTWNKNLPRLIHAIKQLNIPLVMVGKALSEQDFDRTNPWNRDLVEVQRLVEGDSRFIKLGFVPTEDLVSLYNTATVLAMPSLYEGFGLPVVEAMQCGCPVVTTREGSLSEVAGGAAEYVDAHDVQSIVNGIKKIYFNKELQDELSKRSIIQAKKFSWEKTAKETVAVYRKV